LYATSPDFVKYSGLLFKKAEFQVAENGQKNVYRVWENPGWKHQAQVIQSHHVLTGEFFKRKMDRGSCFWGTSSTLICAWRCRQTGHTGCNSFQALHFPALNFIKGGGLSDPVGHSAVFEPATQLD